MKTLMILGLTVQALCLLSPVAAQDDDEVKFQTVPRAIPNEYLVTVRVRSYKDTVSVAPVARVLAERYRGNVIAVYAAYCRCFAMSMPEAEALNLSRDALVEKVGETAEELDPRKARN